MTASWVPDADSCLRWAGSRVGLPFSAPELPQLLAFPDRESYCLTDGSPQPIGFGQLWLRDNDAVRPMRTIESPALRPRGFGRESRNLLIGRAVDGLAAPAATLVACRVTGRRSTGTAALVSESPMRNRPVRR